jgi:hypothetical protein
MDASNCAARHPAYEIKHFLTIKSSISHQAKSIAYEIEMSMLRRRCPRSNPYVKDCASHQITKRHNYFDYHKEIIQSSLQL